MWYDVFAWDEHIDRIPLHDYIIVPVSIVIKVFHVVSITSNLAPSCMDLSGVILNTGKGRDIQGFQETPFCKWFSDRM